jgi:hypothetical protein
MDKEQNQPEESTKVTFQEFLEEVPPGKIVIINPLNYRIYGNNFSSNLPEITLHCDGEFCNGERFFKSLESTIYLNKNKFEFDFVRDEECLDIAQSIRIVLGELASRLAQALKDEAELKNAISKIMRKK